MTKEKLGERGKFLNSIIISDEIEAVDYSVVALLAENSTTDKPCIIVIASTEENKEIYNININMIDSQNATQLEMFALLSYADYQGMTVSGIQGSYINIKSCMEHANQKGYCGNTSGYKIFVTKRFKWVSVLEKMMTDYMQSGVYRQYQFCESVLGCFEELCTEDAGKEGSATSAITMENGKTNNSEEKDNKAEERYEKNVENGMLLNPVTEKLREKILGKMFELSADEIKDIADENTKDEEITANFSEDIAQNGNAVQKEMITTEISEGIMDNSPVKNSFNEDKTLKPHRETELNLAQHKNNAVQAEKTLIDNDRDKFYLADYTICSRPSTKKNRKDVHYVVWYIEEGIFCKRFGEKRWYEWVILFNSREQYRRVIELVRNLPMGEDLKFTAEKKYWIDFLEGDN